MKRQLLSLGPLALIAVLALSACATPTPVTVEATRLVTVTQQVEVTRQIEVTKAVPVTVEVPVTVPAPATAVLFAPRTLNVQVGGGQETNMVQAFLPAAIVVRAGDTVVWKVGGDDIHTVTFNPPPEALQLVIPVPGGGPTDRMIPPQVGFGTRAPNAPIEVLDGANFVTSGILATQPPAPGAPPSDTFSLTFSKPGTYAFLCLIHTYMRGTVTVEANTAADLPEQKALDAQAKTENDTWAGLVKGAVDASSKGASVPLGKSGNQMWFATAGFNLGNASAGTYSFGPKDLTVKAGDSVTWFSNEFHTVTFNPTPPPADFVVAKPQANGPPLLTINPKIFFPARPADVYDPAQYYNSGVIGPGLPNGSTFTLTFDKPGTYAYYCSVHVGLGMKGTVTVTQ